MALRLEHVFCHLSSTERPSPADGILDQDLGRPARTLSVSYDQVSLVITYGKVNISQHLDTANTHRQSRMFIGSLGSLTFTEHPTGIRSRLLVCVRNFLLATGDEIAKGTMLTTDGSAHPANEADLAESDFEVLVV